jgi:hypothetical protein
VFIATINILDLVHYITNPRYYGAGYLILFNFENGDDIPQIGSLIFVRSHGDYEY